MIAVDRLPQQSLAEVRETLKTRLQAIRHEKAQRILAQRLRDRYRPITVCNEDLLLALSRNGPPLDSDALLATR